MGDIGAGILPSDGAAACAGDDAVRLSMTVDSEGWAFRNAARSVFVGQRLAVGPGRALVQASKRGLRAMLGFGDDACETAVAHDRDEASNGAGAVLLQPH